MKPAEEEPFDAAAAGGGDALPRWLVVLYAVLLSWGGWYLVHFWSGAGGAGP
jgi:hypothetical protein